MRKIIFALHLLSVIITFTNCHKFGLDEHWVCNIKKSCFECLRLDHCSWCPAKNKCFSTTLIVPQEFCKNDTVAAKDFGLSLDGNAECACNGGDLEHHCRPPGVTEGPECSGRGSCECGRCVCDIPNHPTQTVLGEYCEFDNFSCDGPDCDEGPYPLSPPADEEENTKLTSEITPADG